MVTTGYPSLGKRSDLKDISLLFYMSEVVCHSRWKYEASLSALSPHFNSAHAPWSPPENVSWGTDISAQASMTQLLKATICGNMPIIFQMPWQQNRRATHSSLSWRLPKAWSPGFLGASLGDPSRMQMCRSNLHSKKQQGKGLLFFCNLHIQSFTFA